MISLSLRAYIAAIGEGGMRPDHQAAGIAIGRLHDVRAADFLVAFRSQPGDDQVALFVEEEKAVADS